MSGREFAGAVARLLSRVELFDGVAAVGEAGLTALKEGWEVSCAVVMEEGEAVAYGWSDGVSGEIAVDPARRRRGLGTRVARELARAQPGSALWAHGNLPAARAFAASLGLHAHRELRVYQWQAREVQVGEEPAGYRARAFAGGATGRDAGEFLAANALIFAAHPEQGRLEVRDLAARLGAAWFDPARFTLVHCRGQLAAFGWVKPGGQDEIYLVGVHPRHEGRGLASWLVRGMQVETWRQGKGGMFLYVEGDNAAAIRAYERAGFAHSSSDIQYSG